MAPPPAAVARALAVTLIFAGGAWAQAPCPAGPSSATGLAPCTACPAGTFSNAVGAVSPCPPVPNLYAQSTLMLLRVGDGVACPNAASFPSTCTSATSVYLDTFDTTYNVYTPASAPIPGITMAGNDYAYSGQLTQCADGSCLTFGAQDDAVGTASPGAFGYGPAGRTLPGNRVVVRVTQNKAIDTSTRIPASAYPVPISGVCAASSTSGYWITSMATTFPAPGITVGYVAHGSTTSLASVGTPIGATNAGLSTGCFIASSPRRMYLTRNYNTYGYIDTTTNLSDDWTTTVTTSFTTASSNIYSQRSILVNRAQTRIWGLASSYTSSYGIYSNTPGVVPAIPITVNPIPNLAYSVSTTPVVMYQTGM